MPPRTSWSNLLPGLIALAVVVSIAIGVVVFGGVGKDRGDTMRLYVLTNAAQGVMGGGGTEVWLVGQKIGAVDRIDFRSPETDTSIRVVLALTVRREDAGQIRHDSRAQIRTGGTVIGPAVVYLTAGTPSSPAIASGDTLRALPQADAVGSGTKLMASASQELGPLMADARTVIALARGRKLAAQGSFIEEHDGEVAALRSNFTRLRDLLGGGGSSRSVMVGARGALARADSIRSLLNSPTTSLGRFRRDSTLGGTVARVRDELARVRAQLASVEGSAGRFTRDSAMTRSIAEAQQELTLLMDDMRRRPRRYLAF